MRIMLKRVLTKLIALLAGAGMFSLLSSHHTLLFHSQQSVQIPALAPGEIQGLQLGDHNHVESLGSPETSSQQKTRSRFQTPNHKTTQLLGSKVANSFTPAELWRGERFQLLNNLAHQENEKASSKTRARRSLIRFLPPALLALGNAFIKTPNKTMTLVLGNISKVAKTGPLLSGQRGRQPPTTTSSTGRKQSAQGTCQQRRKLGNWKSPGQKCVSACSETDKVTWKSAISHPVSLVTAYYRIRSKHPVVDYLRYMENFLTHIRTPTYIFTNNVTYAMPEVREILNRRVKSMPGCTHTMNRSLEDSPFAREFGPVFRDQAKQDPERIDVGHNYLLYMVWLLKVEALMTATRLDHFCSTWFMWADIGSFRDNSHRFQYWPSPVRMNTLPLDRVTMELMKSFSNVNNGGPISKNQWLHGDYSFIDSDRIAGTFIVFSTLKGIHKTFYNGLCDTYRQLIGVNHLVVKDQAVYNAMSLLFPKLFAFVPVRGSCGDAWFYLHSWLAYPEERPSNCGPLSKLVKP